MARSNDPRKPRSRPEYLRLLPTETDDGPLPLVAPLLRPDRPVGRVHAALLHGLARRARRGDREARDLLWRAFAPRLEPALIRCGYMTWHCDWTRRDDLPWELDDLRQEAWLVFAELVEGWDGQKPFVAYVMAYFPWRLRNAMRRLGPERLDGAVRLSVAAAAECQGLRDAEDAELARALAARFSGLDAAVLRIRIVEGATFAEIACRLRMPRRTVTRRWAVIRRLAAAILRDPSSDGAR